MTTTTPTKAEITAVVKQRDSLIEQLDRLARKRDDLNAQRAAVEARRHGLTRELADARIDEARDKAGAAKRVAELLAERAELDAQWRVTIGEPSRINPGARATTPHGELAEQIEAHANATKQARRELSALYRDNVEALLAHAAPFAVDAETKLAAAIEAMHIAEEAWGVGRSEMGPLSIEAGLGNLPAFPMSLDGPKRLRPANLADADDLTAVDLAQYRHGNDPNDVRTVLVGSDEHRQREMDVAFVDARSAVGG
jgi:DNA repair exonuclease SbcCD ATPase subunit